MVVGGEQRARAALLPGDVLHRRPGDGQAVEGGGAAAHLVQNQQALGRGELQDGRHLAHLNHEGGLAAVEVVRRADAGEDAVGQRHIRALRGHEGADVGHQHDQRHLTHVGRLARHVGAGDDHDPVLRVETGIIRHELLPADGVLHHRMPAAADLVAARVVDRGADVVVVRRDLCKGQQRVQRLHGLRGLLQARQQLLQRRANLTEQLVLQANSALLRAENLVLQLLELLGDEALGVGQRLLAGVAVGHLVVKGLGDLDVIAEDPVVADLQVLDAGLLALLLLHPGKVFPAVFRNVAQLVQLGAVPLLDHAAVLDGDGRVGIDGPAQHVHKLIHGIQRVQRLPDQRGAELRATTPELGHRIQRVLQRKAVPGVDRVVGDAAEQALHVVNAAQNLPQLCRAHGIAHQFLHRIQAALDLDLIVQRALDPAAQQAAAHGGLRLVQNPQ